MIARLAVSDTSFYTIHSKGTGDFDSASYFVSVMVQESSKSTENNMKQEKRSSANLSKGKESARRDLQNDAFLRAMSQYQEEEKEALLNALDESRGVLCMRPLPGVEL